MSAKKITLDTVKDLAPPGKGNTVVWDGGSGSVTGFGVRITAKGSISFVLRYVIKGRERRMTLGQYPDLTVAVARERAAAERAKISAGKDPLEERERARNNPTVNNLADDYVEWHGPKKREASLKDDKSMLRSYIRPQLGKKFVADLTSRDIERMHRGMKDKPYRANRVLSLMTTMLNLARKWKWEVDPDILKTTERYPEHKRETWLSVEQLGVLSEVLASRPNQQSANAIRLLIMTGARRSEVLSAEWSEFDLVRGVWTKPSHHTKQKKTEHVPLSAPAMQLLAGMREQADDDATWLFPSPKGEGPQKEIKTFWGAVRKEAGINGVRVHDVRHTFASHLVSRGHSLEMVGRLIGHTQAATTRRYAHIADSPLREAANQFGEMFTRASKGEVAEISPLRGKR